MAAQREDLELETDESFQRNEWRLQRVGWIAWSLVIVAALTGLLGSGPLSHKEISAADRSLTIEYDRYLHYHHPTQLTLSAGEIPGNELRIKFDQALLDRLQVERIEPEPLNAELVDDGVIYTFMQKASSPHARVIFHVDYEHIGASQGTVHVVGYKPVTLRQFVYP
jgi:hypothetical protein